jgi:hypothetical protein
MTEGALAVQLCNRTGDVVRVAGVHLDIRFYMEGRFRYSFLLGQTNSQGISPISFDHLQRQLEANQRLFLMDYNTPLADCDNLVGIIAPTGAELIEREAYRAEFWPHEPAKYAGAAANDRVHSGEQKFDLCHGVGIAFELVCEVEGTW